MPELATKADVLALRSDILAMEQRLRASIAGSPDLHGSIAAFETGLCASLEILVLRLTIRFGVMLAVWVVVAAIILKRV
jgi:hypothetical protein